jgi:SulP family sulfate permease
MASVTFVIILGGRKVWPRLPHIMIAVVVTSMMAWYFGYEKIETITPEQIISLPTQQMLVRDQHYQEDIEKLLQNLNKVEKEVQLKSTTAGLYAFSVDEAMNRVNQAKWQIEQRTIRHNFELGELIRLRLRRLITKDGQIVFFVDKEMTPIGRVGSRKWRIVNFPVNGGKLTLHAGGEVVGLVPQGLPSFKPVLWDWDVISHLFMAALVIALVGFTEAITIAKHIATKSRQRLNINQELLSQGLAKCVGSFFQSMPVSGGFTRSAMNFNAGAKTGFSSIVAGCMVMVVLLWLTPLFYYVPYATLAAVIMVGMLGLIDIKEMRRVGRVSRNEGMVSWLTFILTILLAPSLAHAVLLGMLMSLGLYLYETMRPRFSELVCNTDGSWVEIGENEYYKPCDLISLVRFGGSLYFANVSYFESNILRLITSKQNLRYILLDCVGINKLDASGLEILFSLSVRLEEVGIQLWFTRVRQPVFAILKRGGFFDHLGEHHFYKNNEQALEKVMVILGKQHAHGCHLANAKRP